MNASQMVPKIDQSGLANRHKGVTRAGDPGLREGLFLAADLARKVDPTLAAVLATRMAACWRRGETYVPRDTEGNEITEAEGRAICAERFKVSAAVRQARRNGTKAKKLKPTGRGSKESTKAAPASGPSAPAAIAVAGAA